MARLSPDGKYFVTYGGTEIRLWNSIDGQLMWSWNNSDEAVDVPQQGGVPPSFGSQYALFSPNSKHVLVHPFHDPKEPGGSRLASSQMTLTVLDVDSGQAVGNSLNLDRDRSSSGSRRFARWPAVFTTDGSQLVIPGENGFPEVLDFPSLERTDQPFSQETAVKEAKFSPDGCYLLTLCQDNSVRVWDLQSGKPVTPFFKHDRARLEALFSPDGSQVLTVSGTSARLWPIRPSFV